MPPAAQPSVTEPSDAQRQPWLHELSVCVDGNVTALSDGGGDMRGRGAEGVYVDDRRVVSVLRVALGDEPVSPVTRSSSGGHSQFVASARGLGDPGPDPTVELHRHRRVVAMGVEEQVRVVSRASTPVTTELVVDVAGDGADISAVKSGAGSAGLAVVVDGGDLCWRDDRHEVRLTCDAPDAVLHAGAPGQVRVPVTVAPGGAVVVTLRVTATRVRASLFDAGPGSRAVDWSDVRVRAQDSALEPTVLAGLDDLRHLLLTDPADHGDVFAGAGTPWYLTLFGRDALWSARLALPLGTELALGTLRALARRMGTSVDPALAEAPGKVPHEVRRATSVHGSAMALPPVYYGTVDATALWISVLHDAWRWGLPETDVRALLPALRAATTWLVEHASPDDDGLLKYLDTTGTGLANQGWKDSGDAVRWRDGSIADAPIALVEAQAYAVEAADGAAALLEHLGEPGGAALRAYAERMRERVRERFWVGHDAPAARGSGSPSTAPGGPSTGWRRTWGTSSAPGRSTPARARASRRPSSRRRCSTPTACGPSPPTTAASTRSATTPGRSGPTTPPSAPGTSAGTATPPRRRRSPGRSSRRRSRSGTTGRSCTPARWPSTSRRPTRRPAARRRGPPRRRRCCCRSPSGCSPTSPPGGWSCGPAVPRPSAS